jgi:hypothetical protein
MPSSPATPARRTARRLLKLASLGLAGLLAGLLSGCNAAPNDATNVPPYARVSSDDSSAANQPDLPASLDARQIPALRHPPSTRRLQYGSLLVTGEPRLPSSRTRS